MRRSGGCSWSDDEENNLRLLLAIIRRTPPERRPIDINGVIEATLALVAPECQRNNVRVVTDLQPALPPIWADAHQLQQVFLNLFTNAIHAQRAS